MGGFLITQADAHERSSYIQMASAPVIRRNLRFYYKEGPTRQSGRIPYNLADANERSSFSNASAPVIRRNLRFYYKEGPTRQSGRIPYNLQTLRTKFAFNRVKQVAKRIANIRFDMRLLP